METLRTLASKWSAALRAGGTGPLVIAEEIVRISEEWESRWKAEVEDGLSCSEWLRSNLGEGKGLPYWVKRSEAVQKLGESVRRTINHDAAVWIVGNAPPESWNKLVEELTKQRKCGVPLTYQQARSLCLQILGASATKRKHQCKRCLELEAEIGNLRAQLEARHAAE